MMRCGKYGNFVRRLTECVGGRSKSMKAVELCFYTPLAAEPSPISSQCVGVCWSVLECVVGVCCSVLQCVAAQW